MTTRFTLKPMEHLGEPSAKQAFNRSLFAEVAPKYNIITKALSFGRDASWKRILLDKLPLLPAPQCVDLACGTGDLTRMLAQRYPKGHVTGLDLTPEMLDIARKQAQFPNIGYIEGTMNHLPFDNDCLDIVTGGYALRNAPDLDRALDEVARVLKTGGSAAFLDFSKPRNIIGQRIGHFLLKFWGGFWGLLMHGNPDVYGYIADSLKLYPDRIALHHRITERGLNLSYSRRFYGGLLEIVVFKKDRNTSHAS